MRKITVSAGEDINFPYQEVADAVYKTLNQTDNLAVELDFVSPSEIQSVNEKFRQVNSVTDVLSFPSIDGLRYKTVTAKDYPLDVWVDGKSVFLGSLIICKERAEEQAISFNHSLTRELSYLFCHGLLHLFGYDHMTEEDDLEMRALATKVMELIKIER